LQKVLRGNLAAASAGCRAICLKEALADELDGHEIQLPLRAFAEHACVNLEPISSPTIRRWMSSTVWTGTPLSSTIRSSGRTPACAAGLPVTTSTTSTPLERCSRDETRGGSGLVPPAIPK